MGSVNSVDFNKNNSKILAGSNDFHVYLIDEKFGNPLIFKKAKDSINSVVFSNDNATFLVGSSDHYA